MSKPVALTLAILLSLAVSASAKDNASAQAEIPTNGASEPTYPLLDSIFKGGLSQDQLAKLGGKPTLEQTAAAMTPEQRAAARLQLAQAEATAKTPAELKEISKGYLLLDENSPTAGQDAVRLALEIQQKEPGKSDGHTLAAAGLHQMGEYEAAADEARKALKINPNDKAAWATLKLSEDRVRATVNLPDKSKLATLAPDNAGGANVDTRPYKLPIKSRPTKPVPNLTPDPTSEGDGGSKNTPSPLLPLAGATALLTAYGVHRRNQTWNENDFEKPQEETEEEAAKAGRTWTRERAARHARAAGVGLAAGLTFYYGGPIIAGAIASAPTAYRAAVNGFQGVRNSFQTVMASEAGMVGPVVQKTGTAWDSIRAAGPTIAGTEIPKYFQITVNNGTRLWVAPNATKHMAEYVVSRGQANPGLSSQLMLDQFRAALAQATVQGVRLGQRMKVGGWEFEFRQRATDTLPAVVHARYTQ